MAVIEFSKKKATSLPWVGCFFLVGYLSDSLLWGVILLRRNNKMNKSQTVRLTIQAAQSLYNKDKQIAKLFYSYDDDCV